MKEVAVVETSSGQMVIELWPEAAPKTVESIRFKANECD